MESFTDMKKDIAEIKAILTEKDRTTNRIWQVAIPICTGVLGTLVGVVIKQLLSN